MKPFQRKIPEKTPAFADAHPIWLRGPSTALGTSQDSFRLTSFAQCEPSWHQNSQQSQYKPMIYKCYFLCSTPSLQLFFSCCGLIFIRILFFVNEFNIKKLFRKKRLFVLMFSKPRCKVIGHANIESFLITQKYVGVPNHKLALSLSKCSVSIKVFEPTSKPSGVVVRTPELQKVHCRLRLSKLWRPQHQPRPHLPIPFPPKAEARRPFRIHLWMGGSGCGARFGSSGSSVVNHSSVAPLRPLPAEPKRAGVRALLLCFPQ